MKLIASDYDRTFGFSGKIPPENRRAVEAWRAAGNQFVIVTGRPYIMAYNLIDEQKAPCDALIGCNGGMFLDGAGKITHRETTDPAVLPSLIAFLMTAEPLVHLVFSAGRGSLEYSEENGELFLHPTQDGFVLPELLTEPHEFTQVCAGYETEALTARMAQEINRLFSGKLDAKPNGRNCDITPVGIQKPYGIRRYVESLSEKPEIILTIGDQFNDLSMIQAYHGYAMEGSPEALVQAAEGRTVKSVAELISLYL